MTRFLIARILACSFYVLFSCGPAAAFTAQNLIDSARTSSRDPSATGRARFTDAQILEFLNEGQRDAIGGTLCIQKEYSFDTSSASVYYSLPSDFMMVARVLHDNEKMEEKSPAKLDQGASEWETETGAPQNYYINFSSRAKIGIYPYPVLSTDTETIKIEYYAQAAEMETTSTPFNSISEFVPFQQMLTFYAAAEMGYIDGLVAQADRYMQRYMLYKQQFNEFCRSRPGYFPSIAVSGIK